MVTTVTMAQAEPDHLAHGRALLLDGRCPSCAELLPPRSLFRLAPCPRCEGAIDSQIAGLKLAEAVEARGRRHVLAIAAAVAGAHLILGWMPLAGALALLAAAAWIRVGILQPASDLLSPKRRTLTRWTARLVMGVALALTVIATELLTLLPVVGLPIKAVLGAGEVALAAWAVATYVHWQVRREAEGRPIDAGEWMILVVAVAALVLATLAVVLAFAAVASAFDYVLEWLS